MKKKNFDCEKFNLTWILKIIQKNAISSVLLGQLIKNNDKMGEITNFTCKVCMTNVLCNKLLCFYDVSFLERSSRHHLKNQKAKYRHFFK